MVFDTGVHVPCKGGSSGETVTYQKIYSREMTQQTFVGLQDVLKTSSIRLQRNIFTSSKTSWRRLEDVFKTSRKTSWRRLGRRKIVTLKTSWRRLEDMSWRCLEDMSWRRLEDISWRRFQDFLKASKMFTDDICI